MSDSSSGAPSQPEEAADDALAPRAKKLPLLPPTPAGLPDLVPARMINEALYCERLLYLEWVQGEWADNRFTVEGKAVHKRVDKKPQVLKEPASESKADEAATQEERPYSARSVWLSSDRLGITAKLDVVEVEDGRVVPVEYKRGKEPANGPYLPERAQVAAQVMLLRDQGYRCDGGEIYFAQERRRVPVPITLELEGIVRGAVARARALVLRGACPPPLVDDPKCFGCSLAGICLPDEVKLLQEVVAPEDEQDDYDPLDVGDDPWGLAVGIPKPKKQVRRLFPARDDKIPLYVQGQGASLRLSGERLLVNKLGEKKAIEVRLGNTSSVTLYGNIQVSSQALRRLMEEGIPVLFATSGGWMIGRTLGLDTKNVELRAAQYAATADTARALQFSRSFVQAKIANCRTLLRRNHKDVSAVTLGELKQLAKKATEAESIESLLGFEGAAARVYFREFQGMLKAETGALFEFDRRNRRPPRDPVNALLSFCYGLLSRETTVAAQSVGLDPLLGFYHQPRFGRASLALDLMEEFRPVLADSTVISVINNGVVSTSDFTEGQGAVALKPPARKRVIQAMERRLDQLVTHPTFDYRLSYRRVLEIQARLLSRALLGELPVYPGFRVR